nr:hypothetical protein [Tanacetum cinerariifolium]
MAWLPKCEELERAVGGRNWLDMMIVYFDEYAYEQREFNRRLNGLIGEMNEACADRMTECQLADLVNEGREMLGQIEFFVGKLMRDAKGEELPFAMQLQITYPMAALPICDELSCTVNMADWEPQFIYYCERSKLDDIRLARQINALCDTLTTVIDGRWPFIMELDVLSYKFMPGKMVGFIKAIQDKDLLNLMNVPEKGSWLWVVIQETVIFSVNHCCFAALVARDAVPIFVHVNASNGSFSRKSYALKMANTGTPSLQELARAAESDDIRDQLLVLFTREVAEDTKKMENYRELSGQLKNGVRMRDKYIRELHTSDMSDKVVDSIKILKRV